MRGNRLALWSLISLLILHLFSSPNEAMLARITRKTKMIRVLLVPICNPGLSCEPDGPKKLMRYFFRATFGVANFINEVSFGDARVVGDITPWLRPKKRLKSSQELIERTDELKLLLPNNASNVDVIFFYMKLGTVDREMIYVKPVAIDEQGAPALAYIVNGDIFAKPLYGKGKSAITPSTSFAIALLRSLGINGSANVLRCDNKTSLKSCIVEKSKDPYSLFGEKTFSLALPATLGKPLRQQSLATNKINRDGSYEISPERGLTVNLPTPIKLNDSFEVDRLYIEQRPASRFDRKLATLQAKKRHHQKGAFLYFGSSFRPESTALLIDANPEPEEVVNGSMLLLGQEFKVFDTSVTLLVTRMTSTSLTIKIAGLTR